MIHAAIVCLGFAVPQDPQESFTTAAEKAVRDKDYALLEQLSVRQTADHPTDPMGWFYRGFARAARGDHAGAIEPYQNAIRRGLQHFKVHYQLGYCAHRTGRHEMAIGCFRDALSVKPDDPDALYHLGVSLYQLNKDADAERTLTRLLANDSRWNELGRFHRFLARRRLRHAGIGEDYQWIQSHSKSQELKSKAKELWERRREVHKEMQTPVSRFSFSLFAKAGYDSNVLRLPETSELRPTSESDSFLMSFLSGSFELLEDRELTLTASLLDVSYPDLDESSIDAVLLGAEYVASLGTSQALVFTVSEDFYHLDRESLFRRAGVRAGYRSELANGGTLTAALSAGWKEFDDLDDLDSQETGFHLELGVPRLERKYSGRGRYEVRRENADAGDRSYIEHRFELRAETTLGSAFRFRLEGGYRLRSYEDDDRFYGDRREDQRLEGRATLYWMPGTSVQPFLEFEMERNDSNLSDFDYNRRVFSLGTVVVF